MEHSAADESDVALADLPSNSGAHWANRDRERRRSADRSAPFRRPPAMNSFPDSGDDDGETAEGWSGTSSEKSRPATSGTGRSGASDRSRSGTSGTGRSGTSDRSRPTWFTAVQRGTGSRGAADTASRDGILESARHWTNGEAPDTSSGPGSARASFGVTEGPISGARPEPVSPAGPSSAAASATADQWSTTGEWRTTGGRSTTGDWNTTGDGTTIGEWSATGERSTSGDWGTGDSSATGEWSTTGERSTSGDWGTGDSSATGEWNATGERTTGEWGTTGENATTDEWTATGDRLTDEGTPAADPTSAGGITPFPGAGREIRPHRAVRGSEQSPPGARRRSRLATAAVVALSTTVLLGGAVAGVAFFADEDSSLTSVLRLGSGESVGKVATAPLDGRAAATFDLVAATTRVTVRSQDLGNDLYRITAAGDSGAAPRPVLTADRVQLLLSPDGDGASGVVEVLLSSKVTWALRFVGGADEQVIDLTGGRISGLDLTGGSRRVDLTLPVPSGTVPVRVTGAIEEFSITSPAGSPVRVQVDSGAQTVAAGERTLRDVKPGSTLTPKDWAVPNRYDVDAASRVTLLSVRSGS